MNTVCYSQSPGKGDMPHHERATQGWSGDRELTPYCGFCRKEEAGWLRSFGTGQFE